MVRQGAEKAAASCKSLCVVYGCALSALLCLLCSMGGGTSVRKGRRYGEGLTGLDTWNQDHLHCLPCSLSLPFSHPLRGMLVLRGGESERVKLVWGLLCWFTG